MLNIVTSDFVQAMTKPARHRRALVVVDSEEPVLPQDLAVSGYESRTATTREARSAIEDFSPDVVIMEIHTGTEQEIIALARQLRGEASTYALPLVFVWTRDDSSTRNAALSIGVDDYFALSLPFSDVLVRLDSLFWRIEAGRRTAAVTAHDQRLEIDNFMLMLDSVREDIDKGMQGAIGVINAAQRAEGEQLTRAERDRVLSEAHGFLKLYLRRIDTIAFYGPTTLLVYLPRMDASDAQEALSKLRKDFLKEHAESNIKIGLATFPEDSTDVESLIEKAETEASASMPGGLSTPRPSPTILKEAPVSLHIVEETKDEAKPAALVREQSASPAPAAEPPAPVTPAAPREIKPAQQEVKAETARPKKEQPARFAKEAVIIEKRPEKIERAEAQVRVTVTEKPVEGGQPPRADKPRTEKFVSHVVREKRIDDTLEPVVAPPPVRRHSVQTNGGAEARRAAEAAARERERRARGTIMPRRLLLTVSDAARMAQLNSLIRSAGYEARAAFGGQQALDLLRIERPDLLLLDFELQGIDGLETLRRLRKQNGGRLSLPVVLLLPEKFADARQEALALGTRGIVTMPYDPVDLLDTVRTAGTVE